MLREDILQLTQHSFSYSINAENLRELCGENPPPFLLPLVRRRFLSLAPFTIHALNATIQGEIG